MSQFSVTIGPVTLQSFEVPDEISGGGEQSLDVKKYPGGARTIDAFGPDDEPLEWSGIFLDGTAEARCQQLDAMRQSGEEFELAWSTFSYRIVIKSFTWRFRKQFEIAYSIRCEIIEDEVQAAADAGEDPESVMQGDFDDALDGTEALADDELTAAMGDVSDLIGSAQSISQSSTSFLSELGGTVSDASVAAQSVLQDADNAVVSLGVTLSIDAGTDPLALATNLLGAADAVERLPVAFGTANALTRLGDNIADVTGG